MKINNRTVRWLLLFISFIPLNSCIKSNPQVNYLMSFAEVYGYVKYFHPSDEAFEIDWNKFAVYGAQQVLKCKSTADLENTLNSLFKPISPTIVFSAFEINKEQILADTNPNNTNYQEIIWYHKGVGMGMESSNGVYTSNRISKTKLSDTLNITSNFDEVISTELPSGLKVSVPVVLYSGEEGTYPKSSKSSYDDLVIKLNKYKIDTTSIAYRMGNVVNTYNVFKHFYPYFDVIDIDWKLELEKAIENSYQDKNRYEHAITLRKFLSPLKDGHISVTAIGNPENFDLPISWEWIDDKLLLTGVWDDTLNLKVGDEVTHINGKKSADYFEEIKSRISSGTKGWLMYQTYKKSMAGKQGSKLAIKVDGNELKLTRDTHTYDIPRPRREATYEDLGSGVHYINLSMIDYSTFEYLAPTIKDCQGIVFDLRGYPNQNHAILSHFIKEDIEFKEWMQVPIKLIPGKTSDYTKHDFNLKTKKPFLQPKNLVFITDGTAISYAESVMNFVKGAKIGTIIGQPTAGANGNYNRFFLPGKIEIKFTGMIAYKYNKELFHCKGILPDIYIEKTKEGILMGKDEFLEKAIKLVETK